MELWAIIPELIIGGAVLIVLPLASILRGRRAWIVTAIALVALISAGIVGGAMATWSARDVFDGTYVVDGFAVFFKLFAVVATALAALAVHDQFQGHPQQGVISALLLLTCLGAMGLAASQDLALIAIFFQLVAVGSYVLVGLAKERRLATEGALKLFLFSSGAGAVMVYGMSLLYGLTGSLELPEMAAHLGSAPRSAVIAALALVLVGYGYKVTLVPFHEWAPDAYQGAPTSITGYIAVVPKAAGLAVLLRTLLVGFRWDGAWPIALAVLAAITMTVGNLLALTQSSVKRLLACSSIAQMGYVLVAAAVASRGALGTPFLVFYLSVYVFMELGAFIALAAIERRTGSDDIAALRGVGRRHVFASLALSLSLLSLAGIPPLGGFVAKAAIFGAALDARMGWLAVIMAVNMAASLFYFARILEVAYLREPNLHAEPSPSRCSFATRSALVLLALGAILTGVYPQPWVAFANASAAILHGDEIRQEGLEAARRPAHH